MKAKGPVAAKAEDDKKKGQTLFGSKPSTPKLLRAFGGHINKNLTAKVKVCISLFKCTKQGMLQQLMFCFFTFLGVLLKCDILFEHFIFIFMLFVAYPFLYFGICCNCYTFNLISCTTLWALENTFTTQQKYFKYSF